METLLKKRKKLLESKKEYNKDFLEEKDLKNYIHNKNIEKQVKLIDITITENNQKNDFKDLKEILNLKIAKFEKEFSIEIDGNILDFIIDKKNNLYFLSFYTRDMNELYRNEIFYDSINKIIDFYIDKLKENEKLILNYENLNNISYSIEDEEKFVFKDYDFLEKLIEDIPEEFSAHLPRGIYITK